MSSEDTRHSALHADERADSEREREWCLLGDALRRDQEEALTRVSFKTFEERVTRRLARETCWPLAESDYGELRIARLVPERPAFLARPLRVFALAAAFGLGMALGAFGIGLLTKPAPQPETNAMQTARGVVIERLDLTQGKVSVYETRADLKRPVTVIWVEEPKEGG